MRQVFILLLLVAKSLLTSAKCPHTENLAKFSKIADKYRKNSVVKISEKTLLDVELLDVTQVIVQGKGCLVFNQGHPITVKTKGIIVKDDAQLIIGSEDCPHQDQVNIYLEGTRTTDRNSLGEEGDKGIMVTDNGVLQLFGQDKLAWTKLTSTVERFNANSKNIKFRHLDTNEADATNGGLAISIFNSKLERSFFATHDYRPPKLDQAKKAIAKTIAALQTLKDGDLVALSVRNKLGFNSKSDTDQLFDALEQAAGMQANELILRNYPGNAFVYNAWAMVFVYNGNSYHQSYHQQIGTTLTRAVATIDYKGYKVSAVSVIKVEKAKDSYVDHIIMDPSVGYPEIKVLHDISSWNVGDEVLLTSTDFAWWHGEVRRIKKKTGSKSFQLDGELDFNHFGEIERRVDMRGEVALLTRNVKIQGVLSPECPKENGKFCKIGFDSYGGHIKVHESFKSVHIEGIELQFMGQTSDKGFYPLHLHMCRNITGKTAILRRNSIHNTFRRAVTVHGTFGSSETDLGVQVMENVAYDVLGHAFFLEEGSEVATLFQDNLGASIKKVDNDFETDGNRPAVFWITNPKTVMVGNVACGSEAIGIWYTFPEKPVGLSKDLKVYELLEARHTKLWKFERNVVHSNNENGMFFDNILDNEKGKVRGCMQYEPREDPLDENSPWAKSQLVRLTAYKNKKLNTWLRGGYFELMQYSSAESTRGLQIASIGQYFGAVIHDGPTYYDSCWFNGFKPNSKTSFKAGAIGFSTKRKFTTSVATTLTELRFGFTDSVDGNRMFDGDVDTSVEGFGEFEEETATLRDGDGSITDCPGTKDFQWSIPTQLVVPEKYLLTEKCTFRENWHMAACKDRYGKIHYEVKDVWKGTPFTIDKAAQMKRHDLTAPKDTAVEDGFAKKKTEYQVILGSQRFYYSFQALETFPKKFRIDGRGIEKDGGVTVGICFPKGAKYGQDYTMYGQDQNGDPVRDLEFVDSIEEVMSDTTMSKLYQEGRFVYFRLHSDRPRDLNWDRHDTDYCSGRICPRFWVEVKKNIPITPCFKPTDSEMDASKILSQIKRHKCSLPASKPKVDWGAGDTQDPDVDGQWGEWSSWSDCCGPEGKATQTTRYRVCDNPPRTGRGKACDGSAKETKKCPAKCPQ